MNKRLTVAVLSALLPLSLQISAQDVPADKRYFAITTDLSGRATSQETVLYEGKVDWLS